MVRNMPNNGLCISYQSNCADGIWDILRVLRPSVKVVLSYYIRML